MCVCIQTHIKTDNHAHLCIAHANTQTHLSVMAVFTLRISLPEQLDF